MCLSNIYLSLMSFVGGRGFRRFIFLFLAVTFLFPLGARTIDAGTSSAAGNATAEVSPPVKFKLTNELDFGNIRPGNFAGTVVITPHNRRFATGGVKLRGSRRVYGKDKDSDKERNKGRSHGQFSRAKFKVSGLPNTFFTIKLVSSPALLKKGRRSVRRKKSLEITQLKSFSVTQNCEARMGRFNAEGKDTIYVGGTLQVPARAKKGKYEAEVTIFIDF